MGSWIPTARIRLLLNSVCARLFRAQMMNAGVAGTVRCVADRFDVEARVSQITAYAAAHAYRAVKHQLRPAS
jgi:hypothetical protein